MKKRTKGQALIYIGVFMLLFMGFAALAVDGARLYFSAREAQTAADVTPTMPSPERNSRRI